MCQDCSLKWGVEGMELKLHFKIQILPRGIHCKEQKYGRRDEYYGAWKDYYVPIVCIRTF